MLDPVHQRAESPSTLDFQPFPSRGARTEPGATPTGPGNTNVVELPLPAYRNFAASHGSSVPAASPRIDRDRWSAIQDVFSLDPSATSEAATTPALPCGSISLFAVGGGVGKSTIAATLARVLTGMGESVLLAGLSPDSILPLYFGARSVSGGTLRSFLMPRDHGRGSLRLYLDSLSVTHREESEAGNELLSRLCTQAELVKDDIDRALLAFPGGNLLPLMPVLNGTSIWLVILVPDLVSAIGVGKLMRFFRQQERSEEAVSPYFLLNKFDTSRALHQEMRSRLQEQLGDRLLPLVIRRSDDIQDALGAGMTVIDYAPETAAAQDFRLLAEWIAGQSQHGSER